MKKSILFTFVAVGLCLSACKAPSTVYSTRTARSQEMPVETWSSWTTADLEVSDQRVKLTLPIPQDPSILVSEAQYKENAIGELLEKHNADVLINPMFKMDYRNGRLESITVSGYPAKHRNFRTISYEEQTKYLIDKSKAENVPQIVINGGEIINEVQK